jgi:RNA polymerase sigma-70 factor (ECF subfamily)
MRFDVGAGLIELLPKLRRYAIVLARSADLADDLVQAACERALAAEDRLEDPARFEAWVFRILRNLWMDRLRRRRTRGEEVDVDERPDLAAVDAERDPERRMMLKRVAAAMDELPEDQRELLLLVCVEELSYREAADLLGLPMGTVMSRLARARQRLAASVGHERGSAL